MRGERITSSSVMGLPWKIAFGLACAFTRASTAIFASVSSRSPYRSM
jgi:hypothetical protein